MKRSLLLSLLFAVVLLLPLLRESRAGGQELVLFDGPRGGWLATVRNGASLEVLEQRDGWSRVRLEGWIAGLSGVASPSAEANAEEAGTPIAAPPADGGATISGVLLPTRGDQSAGPGIGLVVLLVGDLEALDEEHARAGKACREMLATSQQEIEARRDDYRKQLNSSDNFREATKRNDRARQALSQAEQAHRERIDDCRRAADEVFQRHALRRAISDMAGRFEFVGVPAGEFRVIAAEIGGEAPRAWALDCPVRGKAPVVLDPRTDRSDMLPYWGLERGDGSGEQDPLITFGE